MNRRSFVRALTGAAAVPLLAKLLPAQAHSILDGLKTETSFTIYDWRDWTAGDALRTRPYGVKYADENGTFAYSLRGIKPNDWRTPLLGMQIDHGYKFEPLAVRNSETPGEVVGHRWRVRYRLQSWEVLGYLTKDSSYNYFVVLQQ